jgi:Family of unknown function (DUF6082)
VSEDTTQLVNDPGDRRTVRRLILAAGALLAIAVFLIGSPYLLLAIGHIRHSDWTKFSNEGQAYGGIAAVLGMLALVGVAASLVLQSREAAVGRELAQRTIHADLLSKALDDPGLRACWGPSRHGGDDQDRQHIYTNLIVSFWRSMFEIDKITEDQLRALSARMFANAPGRRYWSVAGPYQVSHYVAKQDRKFAAILDQEYTKASSAAIKLPNPQPLEHASADARPVVAAFMIGTVAGTFLSGAVAAVRHRFGRTL